MERNFKLSEREKEIVFLVANAKCRKTIAYELDLSIHTVDAHLRNIRLKTNTHSIPELIVWAMDNSRSPALIRSL
ncbi:MAG: helix-turn-helix transcriptional regulator [Bacteroidales bacterium]|nr:helix-turn-helix transcriptional regulator [Lentimicrobiaceae bacterium]MDD5694069.1 helix-turn-helix transcriptional regulator [Bacteroidales bacterium]